MKLKPFSSSIPSHFLLKELFILLKGGVSITRALEILASQRKEIAESLLEIKKAIEEGEDLRVAFKKSKLFPEFICEMLVAAQTGGSLENIFLKTSEWIEKMEDFKTRISNALIYPAIVISLSVVAIIIVLNFIVPKLQKILASFGEKLPLMSVILIKTAGIFWWFLILGVPLILIFFWFFVKRKGMEALHRKLLRFPLAGKLWNYFELSRWAYTVALLLDAGIVLPRAISIGTSTCKNSYLRKIFIEIVRYVEEGESFSYQLKKYPDIPPILSELTAIGEETGTLSEMLQNISEIFMREIEYLTTRILKWIEPLSILILGSIIAYIIVSVILPIMKISTTLR